MELELEQRQSARTRRFGRVPFFVPVRLIRISTNQVLELQASNLSESGVFVETVIPFTVGEVFKLVIPSAPGGFEEVAVARISWRRPFSSARGTGAQPGIGISFVMMRPAERRALAQLVEAGGVAAPPPPRTIASRSPVQPRVLVLDRPAPPPERFVLAGHSAAMDVGPAGWLLVAALAAAAAASLLLGLQPLPV